MNDSLVFIIQLLLLARCNFAFILDAQITQKQTRYAFSLNDQYV